MFLCFSRQYTPLDFICKLGLLGGDSNLQFVLLAFTGWLEGILCGSVVSQRLRQSLYTEFEASFSSSLLSGFPLYILSADVALDSAFSFSKPFRLWVSEV